MSNVVVVVGIQWGDEGKGKIVDILSKNADFVVRSQGGNNAGHTIVFNGEECKFHLIPSGILYPNTQCYITGGCVVDAESLISEIKMLKQRGFSVNGRLHLSAYAHLIMPYHRQWDLWQEERKGSLSIGTTKKGIGPCYADKADRIGFRVGELTDFSSFCKRVSQVLRLKNQEIVGVFGKEPIDEGSLCKLYREYADFLLPYISFSVETEIADLIDQGKKGVLEGAHGSYLDQTFGTYPYITSSSTLAAGIAAGAGVGPTNVDHVIGIVKAFTTRVGNGPFPTELSENELSNFPNNEEAREVATTTRRLRRMGWFDAVLVRQSLRWNGADSMAIMKLDVLSKLEEIKICIAYEIDGKRIENPPVLEEDWKKIVPIYETLPGWQSPIIEGSSYEDLPKNAVAYLQRIETLCRCPISWISYGPQRERTIHVHRLFSF